MNKIKFWLMPNGGFESKQTIEQELAFFHKRNPGIEVEYEILSWSRAWFQLMQAIKEKSGPDIIQIGTTWIGTLGYLGAVHKLDKRVRSKNDFVPNFLDICRFFGHLWALPWFCEGRVLYFRKDYLKRSGVNPENIRNWDDFRFACSKIQKNAGNPLFVAPMGFSGQKEQVILQDLACFIWSNGGNFLSNDAKHAALTQSETKHGIKFLAQLISDNLISKTSIELNNGEVAENFFMHDAYAFMLSSSWPLHVYLSSSSKNYVGRHNSVNFGVLPIPEGPHGRFNFAGGSALALTSFGKNPDKAMKLLEHLTGRQAMARYCRNINMLPSRVDVPVVIGADKSAQKVFHDAISKYGRSFPVHPLWGSIEQIILNGAAQTLWDFGQSGYKQNSLLNNLSDINQEIEYMLSLFGE